MPITESLGALGGWTLQLREDTPRLVRDQIRHLGHLTVHTGRVEPALAGDGLLRSSRFTGVVRGTGEKSDGSVSLTGTGMEFWLGDEDDKGAVIETPLTFTAESFVQTVRDILDVGLAVEEGTLHAIAGTYTGTHVFQVQRKAIAYVCATMGGEYRVNGDATLDAGTVEDLYVTDPKTLIVKRGAGVDMDLRALLGSAQVDTDVEDFTTRVVLIAESTESTVATGSADINPALNVYRDLHGNPVQRTRLVSESETSSGNAEARAQLQLNRFTGTRDALQLSTSDYDINGTARVGDYVWVYDPDTQLYDHTNEVQFRGQRLNPVKLRLIETTWPVSQGYMVAYRDPDGVWLDLTDYVVWEAGATTVKVGGYNRSLTGSGSEPIGRLPAPDSSVPGQVQWTGIPWRVGVYQSPVTGTARGYVILTWDEPDNTNATPIVDGSHYQIRYRSATTPLVPVTNDQMTNFTNDQLAAAGSWEQPIQFPETEWQFAVCPWDTTQFRIQDLVPAMPYEVQIRALDLANPSNVGAWSDLENFQTTYDNIPPETPAAPTVAGNLLSAQITHHLGAASGGTFNLASDLHHLEVHAWTEPRFQPGPETLVGKVMANAGMLIGEIPAVASFPITALQAVFFKIIAVDETGNKSLPSPPAEVTADLIDSQYVTELTASKITAGELRADVLVSGAIRTATSGPRVELNHRGLQAYSPAGDNTLNMYSEDGTLDVLGAGSVKVRGGGNVEITDGALIVYNASGNKIIEIGECADGRHGVQVYRDNGIRVARIGELASGTEGMEVLADDGSGGLVRISTLAFESQAASDTGSVNTTSTAFSGSAPLVTVNIGNTGRALVFLSGWCSSIGSPGGATYGFRMAGPGGAVVEADNLRGIGVSASITVGTGRAFLVTGLAAGSWLFSSRYRSGTAGVSAIFVDRHIAVQPF